MEAQIKVKLKPFQVPNFVIKVSDPKPREDGFKNPEGIPLSDLDEATLYKLCEGFTNSVFKKAGKTRPGIVATPGN